MNAYGKGCVIIEDDGRMVKYHPKCEHCGYVDTTTCEAQCDYESQVGYYHCFKCEKTTEIVLYRH